MSSGRALVIAAAVAACSRTQPPAGTERGPCTTEYTCSGGLVCLSDVCVRPPAADCSQVAAALASVKLGNYAPAEQRAPLVSQLHAQCEREELTVAEASCLTGAKSKYAMARCPKPLLPELVALASAKGGCKEVGAHMEEIARRELGKNPGDPMAKMIPQIVDAVVASCTDDVWSPEVQDCLIAASDTDSNSAERCLDKLPPATKDAFMKRVSAIVQASVPPPPPAPPPPPPP